MPSKSGRPRLQKKATQEAKHFGLNLGQSISTNIIVSYCDALLLIEIDRFFEKADTNPLPNAHGTLPIIDKKTSAVIWRWILTFYLQKLIKIENVKVNIII